MEDPPGRDTRPARSPERRTWYGLGTLTRDEKRGFSRFAHDATRLFADVSLPAVPVLTLILLAGGLGAYGPRTAVMVGWISLVTVATAIYGGWLSPPLTDALGWVAVSPVLVALRVVYYNLVLAIASFGSVFVADAVGRPPLSLAVAFVVGAAAALAFPRLGEAVARRVAA